jgi:AraC-like DNA-binding protein
MNVFYSASGVLLLLLSLLLFSKKPKQAADYILGAWFLLIFFTLVVVYVNHNELPVWPGIPNLADSSVFLQGPFIWFYIVALTKPDFRFRWQDSWHLLPFLAATAYLLLPLRNGATVSETGRDVVLVTKMSFLLCYGIAGLYQLRGYDTRLEDYFSFTEKVKLRWLRLIVWGLVVIWVIGFISQLLYHFQIFDIPQNGGYFTNLALCLFVLLLGYFGIQQATIFAPRESLVLWQERPFSERQKPVEKQTETEKKPDPEVRKYRDLLRLMEDDRPYLDGELTLFKLSVQAGLPPHQLSKLINQYGGCNFFDFVNQYRVAAIKEKIEQRQHEQQTLLALALESGFNSKASFNRVFKKMTGMTPRQYVSQIE